MFNAYGKVEDKHGLATYSRHIFMVVLAGISHRAVPVFWIKGQWSMSLLST